MSITIETTGAHSDQVESTEEAEQKATVAKSVNEVLDSYAAVAAAAIGYPSSNAQSFGVLVDMVRSKLPAPAPPSVVGVQVPVGLAISRPEIGEALWLRLVERYLGGSPSKEVMQAVHASLFAGIYLAKSCSDAKVMAQDQVASLHKAKPAAE